MSIGSTGGLAWVFLFSLLMPLQYKEFITQMWVQIFLFEFLSIHSTGMLLHPDTQTKARFSRDRLMMVGIYMVFALTFALAFQNWIMTFIFIMRVLSKAVAPRPTEEDYRRAVLPILFIVGWSFFVFVFTSWLWPVVFPFPPEIFASVSVEFMIGEDVQLILVWGFFYYTTVALSEIYFFFNPTKPKGVKLRDTNLTI